MRSDVARALQTPPAESEESNGRHQPSRPATTTIALKTPTASRAKLPGLGRSVLHLVAEDFAEDVVSFATMACKQTSVRVSAVAGNGPCKETSQACESVASNGRNNHTTQRKRLASKQDAVFACTPQCVVQHSLSYLGVATEQSRSH